MNSENKVDKQLERMKYLMEFKTPKAPQKSTSIEYSVVGADGKAYGIIREGTMYYIKTSTPEKKNLKESYEYIGGFNYRNENGYKSYNEATKHLELKLMKINESFGKHEDVSVVDSKKAEKDMKILTEEARKEINRINQIFENIGKIGKNNTGDPEGKAKATDPTKQGEPFEQNTEASLDKDPKTKGTVKGATPDNKEVKGVDTDLTSDKMKKGTDSVKKDSKDAHTDLKGKNIAEQKPKGAKCVKMNESVFEDAPFDETDLDFQDDEVVDDTAIDEVPEEDDVEDLDNLDSTVPGDETSEDDELVGFEDPSDELESLYEEVFGDTDTAASEDVVTECGVVDGEEPIEECEKAKKGGEEALKGPHGSLHAMSWERLSESVNRIANAVVEKLTTPKKSTLEEKIKRMVNEEITNLNAWGKHPRYQKPAFQTPENKEVIVNKGDRDWNDDSAKGNEPYGKKIGSSAPFNQVVKMLTDGIVKKLQEESKAKKN